MNAVRFIDLTVTHQRHPAVHHLSGELGRAADRHRRPQRRRQEQPAEGAGGPLAGQLDGRIEIAPALAGRIAYLPQQAEIDRSFPDLACSTWCCSATGRASAPSARIDRPLRDEAQQALAAVGLSGFEQRPIDELSVGQFQRVLFARVLLQDAQLILLDEPFNAIDASTSADLLAVVRRWHGEARTVVAVLHDLEQVRAHFPQALLLAREPVAWGPTAQVLHAENLFARAPDVRSAGTRRAPVLRAGLKA